MSLPDLSKLTLNPYNKLYEDAKDGVYCLDRLEDLAGCKSSIIIVRNAVPFSREETLELDEFLSKRPRTLNRYGTYNNRIQTTFGAVYDFGQETSTVPYPVESWPKAVQIALQTAQKMVAQLGIDKNLYNAVHANLYPSGKAGVDAHSDKEDDMIAGLPIISFTLLSGNIVPRNFSILRSPNAAEVESQRSEFERKREERYQKLAQKAKDAGKPPPPRAKTPFSPSPIKLYDIKLKHGDVILMQGEMQKHFLHSVATDPRKALENAHRINLTVRAFKETA